LKTPPSAAVTLMVFDVMLMALPLGSRRAILDAYATAASAIQNPRHFPGSPLQAI
jgi:hypothetical protein